MKLLQVYFTCGWIMLLLSLASCVDSYEPKVDGPTAGLLVVDGGINTNGITTIRLSRSMGLTQKGNPVAETKAKVFIEVADGQRYSLVETAAGTYTSPTLRLPVGAQTRLRFTTAGGREYASDQTTILLTPAIDSLTWRTRNDRLYVYANAHDATGQVRYYRWSFDETWEFTARYRSDFIYRNNTIVNRTLDENIYNCWGSELPSKIVLGNSLRLNQNIISEQPIVEIWGDSPKLQLQYSTLVKQYALTAEEYAYWEDLRKNTEIVGGLYDPLPSQLTGNVHCLSNETEPVLGFVGAQSVVEQRLFIKRSEMPAGFPRGTGYGFCDIFVIPQPDDPDPPTYAQIMEFFEKSGAVPLSKGPGFYDYASPECADCRTKGTNKRPSFWPR
ncbi:DUF4249 domain-containing protein [Hymenobacter pini]|uniref:DUF4249 domain-containing protein n=1 Tax=Hymenobacter pini TaxID=2880879 RepID=UPI001CF583F4|nr:DUF4249 domain-containing protein [Hymenobacter pini]MCA8831458.1 DUF4249 domain-containing protein [Hymenobacter pini]